MSRGLLTVVVALAALGVAGPAWAHVDAPTRSAPVLAVFGPEALSSTMPASPGPWMLAAGLAVTLALTLRRRRALVLALLVLLTFGVFEAGKASAIDPRATFHQQRAGYGATEVSASAG